MENLGEDPIYQVFQDSGITAGFLAAVSPDASLNALGLIRILLYTACRLQHRLSLDVLENDSPWTQFEQSAVPVPAYYLGI